MKKKVYDVYRVLRSDYSVCLLTVFIMVDSELATSTKTSASKQNLSIQLSSSDVTSVPGLQREKSVGY